MHDFSKKLQHARGGEVATQSFLDVLCVATVAPLSLLRKSHITPAKAKRELRGCAFPSRSLGTRPKEGMPPRINLGAPGNGPPPWGRMRRHGEGDFFPVDPKKLSPHLLDFFALCPLALPPPPRPLSRKGRGEQDLGEVAETRDLVRLCTAIGAGPTFFGWTQKKSPLFSAPKKPKKSPRSTSVPLSEKPLSAIQFCDAGCGPGGW